MDHPDFNTGRAKGKHLTHEECVRIQIHLKDGWSAYQMAKEIGCAAPFRNEIKRGQVLLYHGTISRYKASAGQAVYEDHRQHSRKRCFRLAKHKFIEYVLRHFKEDGWSLAKTRKS